jgi:hypothetical protein
MITRESVLMELGWGYGLWLFVIGCGQKEAVVSTVLKLQVYHVSRNAWCDENPNQLLMFEFPFKVDCFIITYSAKCKNLSWGRLRIIYSNTWRLVMYLSFWAAGCILSFKGRTLRREWNRVVQKWSCTLKMETAHFSETLAPTNNQTASHPTEQ